MEGWFGGVQCDILGHIFAWRSKLEDDLTSHGQWRLPNWASTVFWPMQNRKLLYYGVSKFLFVIIWNQVRSAKLYGFSQIIGPESHGSGQSHRPHILHARRAGIIKESLIINQPPI